MKKYVTPMAEMLILAQEDIMQASVLFMYNSNGIDNSEDFGEFKGFGF